jgi:hypothetical protein
MGTAVMPPEEGSVTIRARLLRRLGNVDEAADPQTLQAHVQASVDDIRNGLVPLQTVASLLDGTLDAKSQKWCREILGAEINRLLRILENLSTAR